MASLRRRRAITIISRLAIGLLLAGRLPDAGAQPAYRCDTPDGPVFSDRPCGDDAETLELKIRRPRQAVRSATEPAAAAIAADAPPVPAARVPEAFFKTAPEVREILGPPAAAYRSAASEHWFYPNIVRRVPAPASPEIRFEDGRFFEVEWLAPTQMARSVGLARGLAHRTRGRAPQAKAFTVDGVELRGLDRDEVRERLGEPDDWRIEAGSEIWFYRRVPITAGAPPDAALQVVFGPDGVLTTGAAR